MRIRAGLVSLVLLAHSHAQRTWNLASPPVHPTARYEIDCAFDAARQQMVLFGGLTASSAPTNETWLWNGTWSPVNSSGRPSPRWAMQLAYDSIRQRVLLFGGHIGGGTDLADTWIWDGANWTQLSPLNSPPPRANGCMQFDPNAGRILLFGGRRPTAGWSRNDFWQWDGTNWTQLSPLTLPPARQAARMVHDPRNGGRMLMFGGATDLLASVLADTWTWDGIDWTQQFPASSPPARCEHGLSYDAALGRPVLFGGLSQGLSLADTWEWSGNDWIQILPVASPSARGTHAQAFDPVSRRTWVFGGFNSGVTNDESWLYTHAGRIVRIPHGCGPTSISATGSPQIGNTITATLGNVVGLPFCGLGFMALNQPFCGCTKGHEWLIANLASSHAVQVPYVLALIGVEFRIQGVDLGGTGGCPSPQATGTDTLVVHLGS